MSNSNRYIPKLDADLNALRAFVAIATEGSFSAAAKKVNKTQSAVSLQISKLEANIGTVLFERTSRKVTITEAGEKFLAYTRRILELADEAMLSISAPDTHELFRIGFEQHMAPIHLHPLLARFARAHPNVDLKLHLGIGVELYKELENDELDIVIAGPEHEGGQILFKEPLVWVGPKDYQLDDNVSLIVMPPPCSYRQAAFDALAKENIRFRVTMESNSIQGVQSAVAAGLGISAIAKSAVADDMEVLSDILPILPNTAVMAYTRPGASEVLADRFLTFLMEGFASHGIV